MATAKQISSRLRQTLEDLHNSIAVSLTKNIERGARRNFNKFIPQVSSDDPYVSVFSTVSTGKTRAVGEVVCTGSQVLFIEFGVGAHNRTQATPDYEVTSYTIQENGTYSFSHRTVSGRLGWQFVGDFRGGNWVENAPRPAGIVDLGEYGSKRGRDDYWIRPSIDGVPRTKGEMPVAIKNNPSLSRTDVVWTTGHQPARALYRAVRSSMKSLENTFK